MSKNWIVVLIMIVFSILPIQAARLDFNGFYKLEFNRLPSEGLMAQDQLVINGEVRGPVNLYLRGLGVEGLWRKSIHDSYGPLSLDLKQAFATVESSFLPEGKPLMFRFGTLALDYSPYFLKQDGSGASIIETDEGLKRNIANPHWRGLSVEGVPIIGELEADGFLFWENSNSDLGMGTQVRLPLSKLTLKGTYVAYTKNPALQTPSEQEQVYGLEFIGNLPFRGKLEGTFAQQVKSLHGIKIGDAAMGTVTYLTEITPEVSGKLSYKNFEPEYDPRYRDRTPRFSYDGELLSWNSLDEQRGQKGYGVGVKAELTDLTLEFAWENYLQKKPGETISEIPTKEWNYGVAGTFLGIDVNGEYNYKLEERSLLDPITGIKLSNSSTTRRVFYELVKKSLPVASKEIDLGYRYYTLGIPRELEPQILTVKNPYLALGSNGPLKFELGYQMFSMTREDFPRLYLSFAGQPSLGVSWEVRYMPKAPPIENIYDLDGKTYFDYGNFVRVNLAAYF